MLQNLYPLLPRHFGPAEIAMAGGVAVIGTAFWLVGARFSRPILATAATLGGGLIGYQSPQRFGWNIDPWTVAVLGALVLGVSGFFGHRWLAAAGLGLIMGAWGALTTLCAVGLGGPWIIPVIAPGEMLWTYLALFPQSIPESVKDLILASIGIGTLGGWALAYFWHRLGVVLFWSLLGVMMALLPMLCVAVAEGSSYTRYVPSHAASQAAILLSAMGAGAALQWKITFTRKKGAGTKA